MKLNLTAWTGTTPLLTSAFRRIKPQLMTTRSLLNKALILSVFGFAGWLLARSFYYGSFIGILLALIAIIAWGYFLYQLNNLQSENETAEELPGSY